MTGVHFTEAVRDEQILVAPVPPTGAPALVPASGDHGSRDRSRHRPSHLDLLDRVPRYFPGVAQAELSAVVVPTSRPLARSRIGLELAARCAELRGAQLVVLRSGRATADRFPADLCAATTHPTVVIDVAPTAGHLLPALRNAHHPVATRHRRSDLGLKRNLALLLGLHCGWETVLLLDDDITTRRASQLPRATLTLPTDVALRLDDVFAAFAHNPHLKAAGYLQKDFDDNSVVCHVRRLAGRPQEGFISGGALVVRCTPDLPFFPAAYNEDWLFLFALMLQDHQRPSTSVQRIGTIHQNAYYPFMAPRARAEELGDVLAEGLYALLDQPPTEITRTATDPEYWTGVVHERKRMITSLLTQFQDSYGPTDHPIINDVDHCLRTALTVYPATLRDGATLLAGYVETLMDDLDTWYRHTEQFAGRARPAENVTQVLDGLRLGARVEEIPYPGERWLPRPRRRRAS